MNKLKLFTPFAILIFAVIGCNLSTANMSKLVVSKDKEGKSAATKFSKGDTIYALATISNSMDKVKVNTFITVEDAEGKEKGEKIEGTDVNVELDGDGTSVYSVPVDQAFPPGKYKLTANMINEAGETKDSKTAEITVEEGGSE